VIGVVVVTHGQLAAELVNAAEAIVGDLPQFAAVSIGWHDDTEDAREEIRQAIARLQDDSGVLVLTDMFGGTPTNLGLSFVEPDRVEVVTGVNLPMLIKLEVRPAQPSCWRSPEPGETGERHPRPRPAAALEASAEMLARSSRYGTPGLQRGRPRGSCTPLGGFSAGSRWRARTAPMAGSTARAFWGSCFSRLPEASPSVSQPTGPTRRMPSGPSAGWSKRDSGKNRVEDSRSSRVAGRAPAGE
jgi:PTS system mannose-specific IIA component